MTSRAKRREPSPNRTTSGSEDGELLLVGISTRALAEAALRADVQPRTVDLYGDMDQKEQVENVALGRDLDLSYSAAAAASVAAESRGRSVAYGADVENDPAAVERLARGRELLGNSPPTLAAVRDPERLFAVLRAGGVPVPATVFPPVAKAPLRIQARDGVFFEPGGHHAGSVPGDPTRRWLLKPRRGGGGRGIRFVDPGDGPQSTDQVMIQEFVVGPVLSLAFLADGSHASPLALSRELADRETFGATPFGYCGSLSDLPAGVDEASIREQAWRAAGLATRAFGLRGWNGMDFVLRAGEVVPLEINPRHTSSMELWDSPDRPLFRAHAAACRGRLEEAWLPPLPEVRAKAVLFAREDVIVDESRSWLEAPLAGWGAHPVADIPYLGDRIAAGQPVCTLYARARSGLECVAGLKALARRVEADLNPPAGALDG